MKISEIFKAFKGGDFEALQTVTAEQEKQIDALRAQNRLLLESSLKSDESIKALEVRAEKAESDLAASVANQSDFDARVEKAAGAKAAEITGSHGVAPIGNLPKEEKTEAKGQARWDAIYPDFARKTHTDRN